ncbi:uncharacterized protein LOC126844527 isoform X2 [Adelges cooleyi]|uniref:uncharacterized protein LOC126844527 isoform X1 n=1 Tax=Adelges cooleyi TaxID=133065 RepID=UPI0021800B64|nr:uncharacterized protein LOC126844527 isoform X1 [Adelges cooleyi]XP_050438763.1 uncharacterized protein LOC126844527 isoform X2 [Adelges cooleyi]
MQLTKNMFALILYCLIITANLIPESKTENAIERTFDADFLQSLSSVMDDIKKWVFEEKSDEVIVTTLDEHDILLLSTPYIDNPVNNSKKTLLLQNIEKMFESLECFHSLLTCRLFNIIITEHQERKKNQRDKIRITLWDFYKYVRRVQAVFSYGNFDVQPWQTAIYSRLKEMEMPNVKSLEDLLANIKPNEEKDRQLVNTIMNFGNRCQDKHYLPQSESIYNVITKSYDMLTYYNWLNCKMDIPCVRAVEGAVTRNFFLLPEEETSEREKYIRDRLRLSQLEISSLDEQTSDSTKFDECKHEWSFKLTAEKFGRVCRIREPYLSVDTVVEEVVSEPTESVASKYDATYKQKAIEAFQNETHLTVVSCRGFVDKQINFLAAKPDGLIGNNGLVMVKCPHNVQNVHPKSAVKKLQYLEYNETGDVVLKTHSDFYIQVQGQLHIAQKDYCYFVVWNPMGVFYEKIKRDDDFWNNEMKEKLVTFYNGPLLNELTDPQHVSLYNKNVIRK